jgi:nuclear transport factor 2 (NTF2) superfamily protein
MRDQGWVFPMAIQGDEPMFTRPSAVQKVAEIARLWSASDPVEAARVYAPNATMRVNDSLIVGRGAITGWLSARWPAAVQVDFHAQLWGFSGNRFAIRFRSEWQERRGIRWQEIGLEIWEFSTPDVIGRSVRTSRRRPLGDVTAA